MRFSLLSRNMAVDRLLSLTCAMTVVANAAAEAAPETVSEKALEEFGGIIASLNPSEDTASTVTVDGLLTTRTFNVTEHCRVFMEAKPAATSDLRAGQKVEVRYKKIDGVLIAKQINQRDEIYTGQIATIDPEKRIMEVGGAVKSREFVLPADCTVILHENRAGSIEDLHTGQQVSVVYESPPDKPYQARAIEQQYKTYSGTVRAIDADERTVRAKTLLSQEKFNLASDCRVILADNTEGALRDLRIGDRVQFTYQNEDGALVANLITQRPDGAQEDATAQSSAFNGTSP